MKKIRTNKHIIAVFFLLLLCACKEDDTEINLPSGDVMSLHLQLPGLKAPGTYAIDGISENHIKELDVLVFEVDGADEKYLYRKEIAAAAIKNVLPNGSEKIVTINLDPTGPGEKVRVVVIANAHNMLPVTITPGIKKEDLLKDITFSITNGHWKVNSNLDYDPFPMWGETGQIELKPLQDITPVRLIRALAKVEVGLSYTGDEPQGLADFKLEKVHIYNVNTKGYLLPAPANFSFADAKVTAPTIPSGSINHTGPNTYIATGDKEVSRQIYIAEGPAGIAGQEAQNTCLIIEGLYKGQKTFYRIDLSYDNKGVKTYLPVMRNYRYRFNVVNVKRLGAPTINDAFTEPAMNDYYTIVLSVDDEFVTTDGQYYLQSSEDVYNIVYYTATNGHQLHLKTNAPNGWSASTGDSWITLTSAVAGPKDADAVLTFDVAATTQDREGTILIRAANIYKEIKVIQKYCELLPANLNNYGNSALEVFLFDQPIGHNWYQYANIPDSYGTVQAPPFPSFMQVSPPRKHSCAALDAGGHTDWRLPTYQEAVAILYYSLLNDGKKMINYKDTLRVYPGTAYGVASSEVYNKNQNVNYNNIFMGFASPYVRSNDGGRTYILVDNPPAESYRRNKNYTESNIGDAMSFRCVRGDALTPYIITSAESGLAYDLYLARYDHAQGSYQGVLTLESYGSLWFTLANRQNGDYNNSQPIPSPPRKYSCAELNINGGEYGYTDWRMPTIDELDAIFSVWNTSDLRIQHAIYEFTYQVSYYCSSTDGSSNSDFKAKELQNGTVTDKEQSKIYNYNDYRTRCVRGN